MVLKPIKNNLAFTLIEVMIALVVMSIGMIALLNMSSQSTKALHTAELANASNSFSLILGLAMQNSTICSNNLANKRFEVDAGNPAGLAAEVIPIPQITYGTQVAKVGSSPSEGLTITKLQLDQFLQLTLGTSYAANLHVELTKAAGTFLGSPTSDFDIPISLQTQQVGSNAKIISCGSSSPQMRSGVFPGASCGTTINFTSPFPGGCTSVVANLGGGYNGNHAVYTYNCNVAGFTVNLRNNDGECVSGDVGYIAVGF